MLEFHEFEIDGDGHRSGAHFVVVACAFEFADFAQTALKRQFIEALSPVRRGHVAPGLSRLARAGDFMAQPSDAGFVSKGADVGTICCSSSAPARGRSQKGARDREY